VHETSSKKISEAKAKRQTTEGRKNASGLQASAVAS